MSWLTRGRPSVFRCVNTITTKSNDLLRKGYRTSSISWQQQQQKKSDSASGSLFGEISENKESADSRLSQLAHRSSIDGDAISEVDASHKKPISKLTSKDLVTDPEVQEFINPKPQTAVEKLLSPLKQQLYSKAINFGQQRYVSNQKIELDGKTYKLALTKDELEVLQPSVYLQSYRIKSSLKKTYIFLRMLRGMDLKKAINQCHFSSKKVSRDVGDMLSRGLKQAEDLKLDPDQLYVEQIWVGKDGTNIRRLDFKGRGRIGTITHKWVHVKAVLRPISHRDQKVAVKVSKVDNKPVWEQLKSRPVHYPLDASYKW